MSETEENKSLSEISPEGSPEIEIVDEFDITIEELPTFKQFKDNGMGRPKKYTEDMPERLFNFFMKPRIAKKYRKSTYHGREIQKIYYEAEKLPTVEAFCVMNCINKDTFYDWLQKSKEFSDTYDLCKLRQKDVLVQNMLEGQWQVQVGSFISVNYTDMKAVNKTEEGSGSIENTPERKKGYDVADIDSYCQKTIETTARDVTNG